MLVFYKWLYYFKKVFKTLNENLCYDPLKLTFCLYLSTFTENNLYPKAIKQRICPSLDAIVE